LLRDEVSQKTKIGTAAETLMKDGLMVPSQILLTLLKKKIEKEFDRPGILIDGFPRTLDQAVEFEKQIGPCRRVIAFSVPLDKLEERLIQRGKSSGRADDNLKSIKKRLTVFTSQSEPVIRLYSQRGLCTEIAADRSIEEVYKDASSLFTPVALNHNNIVFVLGGPGSGKGTQCERLAKEFGYLHVSTGDLLRDEVACKTNIGREAESLMKEGKMVPSHFLFTLLKQKIKQEFDRPGILIDGFPRTIDQALDFEKLIGPCRAVLAFIVPLNVLQERLVERGKTSGRADDNLESIQKRLQVFTSQSEPVIEHYKKRQLCIEISANREIDKVFKDAAEVCKPSYPIDHHNIFLAIGNKQLKTREKLYRSSNIDRVYQVSSPKIFF
jgi:adenylate kinase